MLRVATFAVVCLLGITLQAGSRRPPLGLDLYRPVPEDNPLTRHKIALGRRLFHDRRLSRDGTMACASCHDPGRAFADGRVVAIGIGGAQGRRNVPSIINRAWGTTFLWDGRAVTLEQQVLQPILNPLELGSRPQAVIALARSDAYRRDFLREFGAAPSLHQVSQALATYVRSIVSGDSPYDRFAAGRRSALSPSAQRGLTLFTGRAGCSGCHVGATFTDEQFHNTGVAWARGTPDDIGRGGVTGTPEDHGAFKTPSLRNVARTSPYMHDGSLATLEDVIAFYDRGGQRNAALDSRMRPLGLSSAEKQHLREFLESLTGLISEGDL